MYSAGMKRLILNQQYLAALRQIAIVSLLPECRLLSSPRSISVLFVWVLRGVLPCSPV